MHSWPFLSLGFTSADFNQPCCVGSTVCIVSCHFIWDLNVLGGVLESVSCEYQETALSFLGIKSYTWIFDSSLVGLVPLTSALFKGQLYYPRKISWEMFLPFMFSCIGSLIISFYMFDRIYQWGPLGLSFSLWEDFKSSLLDIELSTFFYYFLS